jgi:hypothetical protein
MNIKELKSLLENIDESKEVTFMNGEYELKFRELINEEDMDNIVFDLYDENELLF